MLPRTCRYSLPSRSARQEPRPPDTRFLTPDSRPAPDLRPLDRSLQFPLLIEKSRVVNPPGRERIGWLRDIDDRPVRQLRILERIRAIVPLAEGEAGVKDEVVVAAAARRRRENHRWRKAITIERLAAK